MAVKISERQSKAIELYRKGLTLRQVGARLGVSMQAIHHTIRKYAPHLMRPPHNVNNTRVAS